MTGWKAFGLLVNGIIAFGLNVVSFTANKKTSALTMSEFFFYFLLWKLSVSMLVKERLLISVDAFVRSSSPSQPSLVRFSPSYSLLSSSPSYSLLLSIYFHRSQRETSPHHRPSSDHLRPFHQRSFPFPSLSLSSLKLTFLALFPHPLTANKHARNRPHSRWRSRIRLVRSLSLSRTTRLSQSVSDLRPPLFLFHLSQHRVPGETEEGEEGGALNESRLSLLSLSSRLPWFFFVRRPSFRIVSFAFYFPSLPIHFLLARETHTHPLPHINPRPKNRSIHTLQYIALVILSRCSFFFCTARAPSRRSVDPLLLSLSLILSEIDDRWSRSELWRDGDEGGRSTRRVLHFLPRRPFFTALPLQLRSLRKSFYPNLDDRRPSKGPNQEDLDAGILRLDSAIFSLRSLGRNKRGGRA